MIDVTMTDHDSVTITGEATVYQVETLHSKLHGLPINGSAVALDLEGVKEVDAAGLQVLLAFLRRYPKTRISKASGPLRQLIEARLFPTESDGNG